MGLIDSFVVFAVSLLVGGLGIHLGAGLVVGESDYEHAVWTAAIGAFVWGVAGFLFGGIPFLGPILTFLAYLAVIKWRYPGGWVDAGGIALVAWVASLGVLYVLATVGVGSFGAVGVPGV